MVFVNLYGTTECFRNWGDWINISSAEKNSFYRVKAKLCNQGRLKMEIGRALHSVVQHMSCNVLFVFIL